MTVKVITVFILLIFTTKKCRNDFCSVYFCLTKHTGILYTYAMTSKLKLTTEKVIYSSPFNKNR